ncbi:MAG TPA: metallophosphoesterase [Methyloceanibacter sp.]|nr:metallophosphoesterase [Methyloceanibacter sp.]
MARTRKRQVRKVEAASVVDPRHGDIEDDASSTKRNSMLSLAGNMLVEISWPKLILAWTLLLIVPGLLLGLAPIVVQEWFTAVSNKIAYLVIGIWSVLFLVGIIALGWFGWRALFRLVEASFWALNSIVVQPGYAMFREGLRHINEKLFAKNANDQTRANLRAASAAIAGVIVFALSLLVLRLVWPHAHLYASLAELSSWRDVALVALANSTVVIAAYLGGGALIWGFADAMMAQPRNLRKFQTAPRTGRQWRVAHLSDIHVVGERYGFRIESGRWGPRGNDRLKRLLKQLEAIDAKERLDLILITGDMTDAGISTEWAALYDILADHPRLADRILMIPGNHDLNIVDRANPARLDLPTSPNRRLRQIRCLSAMDAIQGSRVRVIDREKGRVGGTLDKALRPHRAAMVRFADMARPRLSYAIPDLWARSFPMIVPPDKPDGLGVILLDSNADAHFLHQRARPGHGRANAWDRDCLRDLPGCLLDYRVASPCDGISLGGEGVLRAHRHRSDQRQLVHPQPQALDRPGDPYARPPARRLDRRDREASGGLGALPGHGGHQRARYRLLHSYLGGRSGWRAQAADA